VHGKALGLTKSALLARMNSVLKTRKLAPGDVDIFYKCIFGIGRPRSRARSRSLLQGPALEVDAEITVVVLNIPLGQGPDVAAVLALELTFDAIEEAFADNGIVVTVESATVVYQQGAG
jgi:hypothetical protein